MKWQRVEVADPILLTRKQGREPGAYLVVEGEYMVIERVVSPTVAYVSRMPPKDAWMVALEDTRTPFVSWMQRGHAAWHEAPQA